MNKYRIALIISLLTAVTSYAQNPRLALYESSPMLVNPAYTGYYPGKIRVTAHGSYMTTNIEKNLHTNTSIEIRNNYDPNDPLPRKFLAVGLSFYRYGHSSSPLSAMFPSLSFAYHSFIDRRKKHGISVGLQAAYAMGTYNASTLAANREPDWEISGGGFATKFRGNSVRQASLNYTDFSLGAMYSFKARDLELELGLSIAHLFYPQTDIFKDKETKQRHRGVATLKVGFELNQTKKIFFKSMYWRDGLFWLSNSLNDTTGEYIIGGLKAHFWLGLELLNKPLQDRNLNFSYGIFTRSLNTIMPVVEATYKKKYMLRGTYEYPINSANFNAYRAKRIELALVVYINPRSKVVPFTED